MLEKQRGAPCAHCGAPQAPAICPDCRLQVCASCREDRRRCPDPRPDRRSLGLGAHVLDIDSSGRFVLLVNWYGTCKVFDLEAGRLAKEPRYLSRARTRLAQKELRPRAVVLPSGAVASISGYRAPEGFLYDGTDLRSPSIGRQHFPTSSGFVEPAGILAAGLVVLILVNWRHDLPPRPTAGSTIDVVDAAAGRVLRRARVVDGPLITGAVCVASQMLALGSDRAVVLRDLSTFKVLAQLPLADQGLAWIALGEGILATVTAGKLRVLRWEGRVPGAVAPIAIDPAIGGGVLGPCHASLSPDGRLIAARAVLGGLAVSDLETGAVQKIPGDNLELVRFVAGDRLVTAAAGGLAIWQRLGTRISGGRR